MFCVFGLFKITTSKMRLIEFLCVLLLANTVQSTKLNVARVLLPVFDEISTNFTLQSTDSSCLRWTTTRDDVVKITPIDYCPEMDCASSVYVSTLTRDRNRINADIFAEDPMTKQMLRCVVIFDVIHSLAITTKTRELVLEEAPEIFEVRAYDVQGNEFSTLSGIPLVWYISPLGSLGEMPVIQLTPFKDSSYGTPESLVDLEERGLWGDKVLLEGSKTGSSKVSVKLSQKEYEHVKSNEIILTVVANLVVLPQEVYVMVGDVVQFRVIQTSYGKVEEINLKTSQYSLRVVDTNIASDGQGPGAVKAQNLGDTKIRLHDKNMDASVDLQVPMPSATIHVVKPAYMLLSLLPHRNWVTMVTELHEIIAEIYTEDDRKLTLGSDFNIHTSIGDAFHVKEKASNGSWVAGWTKSEGTALVTATLSQLSLKANAEMVIHSRIVLSPSVVILPWDPVIRPKYDIDLKATGGDGKFLWSSTNNSVGIVTQFGRVHTHSIGSFQVSAAMQKNHNNRETAKFFILPPSKLEIIEFVMEAEVGTMIYLHVALYVDKPSGDGINSNPAQIPVTRCQDLNFKVRMSDPKFVQKKGAFVETIGASCGNIAVLSSDVGTGKVTISYQIGEIVLQDSVSLTFFKPLKLIQPAGTIVLAVGSASNIIFCGGPKTRSGVQNSKLEATGDEFVTTTDVTSKHKMPSDEEYRVVHVLCKKLGQSNVTLSISNPPSVPTCKNDEASTTVTVVCGKPRRIEIQPQIKVADANSCPMDLSSERIVVQSEQEVDLIIKVLDNEGREFLNVSSLAFNFETKPSDNAEIGTPATVSEMTGVLGSAVYANKSYQKITPKIDTGEIVLTASIIGYNENVLKLNNIKAEVPAFADSSDALNNYVPINATISLILVDDTVVTPNEVSIYNHPRNKIQLDVKQGSGYYTISMTRDDVVNVNYLDNTRKLDVVPINKGDVGIKLIDLCLINKPAQVRVNVVSIHSIRAEMSDKVEIGKCITCKVSLHDESGHVMAIPNLELIEMSHYMDNTVATIERLVTPISKLAPGEIEYVISGTDLGNARLFFYIGDPDFDGYVASDPVDFQVFPPLRILPRVMTLAVGAVLQYTCRGGPQPTSDMEFNAVAESVATICTHGVATGRVVGKTKVDAKAVGITKGGQKIIYTEDSAELQVINLAGVKIAAPATKIRVGAKVPLWATGKPEQITPLILATIRPSLEFSWNVKDAHIARICDIIENNKVEVASPNLPFVRVRGLAAGHTVVYLNATMVKNKKTVVFASSMEIDIIEPLRLLNPSAMVSNSIHIAPNSQTQLRTNAEVNNDEIVYRLMGDAIPTTDVQYKNTASQATVMLSREGHIQTNTNPGTAIVIASSIDETNTKQCMMIPIEVKPVHYMMLTMGSSWRLQPHTNHYFVPLGSEFDIVVTYCDNLGNQLIATGMESSIRSSRHDLTQVHRKSNDTFTIATKKAGVTVLQISSDCNDRVVDYVKLNVTQVVAPHENSLVVGDVLCFFTPVHMPDIQGVWTSSDPATIQIDAISGIATAVSPGTASIFHSFHTSAPIQMTINPIKDIQLVAHNTTFTNAQEYKLYAVMQAADKSRAHNFLLGYACQKDFCCVDIPSPFNCSLKFDDTYFAPQFFETRAKFDPRVGKHYCSITPNIEAVQRGHMFPKSDAWLTFRTDRCDTPTKQIKLNFVPGIQIPEDVNLDGNTYAGTLTIYGAPDALTSLSVHSQNDKVLQVGDRKIEGVKLTYSVQLKAQENLELYRDQLNLVVDAGSSNQRLTVGVNLDQNAKGPKCGLPEQSLLSVLHNNRIVLSGVTGLIVMVIVCTYTYLHYVQHQHPINVNVCPCPSSSPTRSRNVSSNLSQSVNALDRTSPSLDHSCYCTRTPEIRRNRRYM